MSTLSIHNVTSDYQGRVILKQLDLTLQQGEIVALLGPSGCGKTTLLKAIAGLQAISEGSISINGQVLSGNGIFVASEQRGVGMIFQDYALFPHLSVADNILFGVKGLNKLERQTRLEDMLELVKLTGLGDRYPHELSGGQQQRVSIARALAYEPELMLLDEPFSNIDAQVRHEMMLEIRAILKQRNVSAVFVTHSKDEAFVFADQLALFEQGRIVQHGAAETLYSNPNSQYVADFLGTTNYLDVTVTAEKQVDSPLGTVFSTTTLPHTIGSKGKLLLRPQQILLQANDKGSAEIIERRFLGSVCHYHVVQNGVFLEINSPMMNFSIGQRVQLVIPEHQLVVFSE
ncbi:ABC transporter [Shewanella algicola]|uniref:ABC transporter ATP-binding protein n=1 Tax=Shewanella algicola TaxID=640633 RepID=A0A9X1Z4Y4_9GAMM|nr:ABC transporter ATP-binding protein [Shewanella algicola]MCL1105555.1 ABC transporter ATP-binding protein [Shewanella algicola]GGP52128.1 ABC transporter [Shewanella algicola]